MPGWQVLLLKLSVRYLRMISRLNTGGSISDHHIITSSHQHIITSSHQHINTSTHHHTNTSSHHHINTSTHQHIITSTHQHINIWIIQSRKLFYWAPVRSRSDRQVSS